MTIDRALRVLAGSVVLATVALGHWVHPGFFLVTAFVGANLLQSGFTNACPAITVFRRLGLPETARTRAGAASPCGGGR